MTVFRVALADGKWFWVIVNCGEKNYLNRRTDISIL